MKDEKILYRPAESAVVIAHGVSAFYLTSGNLSGAQMSERYVSHETPSGGWPPGQGHRSSLSH